MDTFKGQDNEEMKRLCAKNNCELVIVPHNLTNKFQPLDISINQSAKKFISNKFNAWYADRVSKHFSNRVGPDNVIKGFDAAGISEAITFANDVFTRTENPFDEQS